MRNLLFFVSVIAIALSSCSEKIPPVKSSVHGYEFFFKEKNGKVYTGLRQVEELRKVLVAGHYQNQFFDIKPVVIIPAEFDKIEDSKIYEYFECIKDGERYLYFKNGELQLDGKPIIETIFVNEPKDRYHGFSFGGGVFFKIITKEKDEVGNNKIFAFIANNEYGDISDFIPGCEGFFFIKNGKVGYASVKFDYWGKRLRPTEETIPSGKYDRIYEVINMAIYDDSSADNDLFFIAVKGNKKYFLDKQGNIIPKAKTGISFNLLKTRIQNKITFGDVSDKYPKRGGTEICGSIFISIPGYLWNGL